MPCMVSELLAQQTEDAVDDENITCDDYDYDDDAVLYDSSEAQMVRSLLSPFPSSLTAFKLTRCAICALL